jgi:hypothetical protein
VFDLGVPLDNPALAPLVHFIDYLRLTLDAGNALQPGGRLAPGKRGFSLSAHSTPALCGRVLIVSANSSRMS